MKFLEFFYKGTRFWDFPEFYFSHTYYGGHSHDMEMRITEVERIIWDTRRVYKTTQIVNLGQLTFQPLPVPAVWDNENAYT